MTQEKVVLIVEDDAIIRLDAIDIIEHAGFTVIEAADAAEALDILRTRGDVRLLYTDVEMPGAMDGCGLVKCVAADWPDIAIIVTSGRVALGAIAMPPGGQFLPKPVASGDLVAAVGHALG